MYLIEILHQTTTCGRFGCGDRRLYLIEILHQTTTVTDDHPRATQLYLIEILHQTTTIRFSMSDRLRCILSKFYIKPQHSACVCRSSSVVSYRNSTSNHNGTARHGSIYTVVSYRNSTSNHNSGVGVNATMSLYLIEILHQTTT